MRGNGKLILILILCAWGVYQLAPTWQWSRMTPEAAAANPAEAERLRDKSINLGLDLQGGIHMVLGIRADKLKQNILSNGGRRIAKLLKENGVAVIESRVSEDRNAVEVAVNRATPQTHGDAIEKAVEQSGYFAKAQTIDDPAAPDRVTLRIPIDAEAFDREVTEATGRALEIIRNRIDAFGVREPSIHQSGSRKIVVELPGAADPARARSLIGRTAQLQFHRVRDEDAFKSAVGAIDAATGGALMKLISDAGNANYYIPIENREKALEILNSPAAIGKLPAGSRIFLGAQVERDNAKRLPLYLLTEEPDMTGENLEMARIFYDERNRPLVSFEFNSEGAEDFGRLTAELMHGQKRLAIVLDDVVQSAPSVKSRITSSGQIEGDFSHEEARDLAVVLRSGALPAPVEILEDRTIGPSLGRDSIQKGLQAGAIGSFIVILFMLARYKLSGFVADFCLILNIFFLFACLALFKATLTLPGIAGIVLFVGMAVDANILIYERIREELRAGKGAYSALQAGYDRAFTTIFDSNLTTLITAMALYEYGTGPIRGFAVTLSIGIVVQMFTSIVVSRVIFERFIVTPGSRSLSI